VTDTLAQIIYYLNSIAYTGMMYYGVVCIFKAAVRRKLIFLAYLGYVIVASFVFFQVDSGWIILSVNIAFFLGVMLLFSGNLGARLIFALLLYGMSIIADGLVYTGLNYIYYVQQGTEIPTEIMTSIGRTISNIVFLPLLLLLVMIFRKFHLSKAPLYYFKIPVKYFIIVFALLGAVISVNLFFIIEAIESLGRLREIMVQFAIVQFLVLAIVFCVIWLYNTVLGNLEALEKSRLKEQVMERWEIQYKTVQDSQKVIATMNHNLRYHFLTLKNHIINGEAYKAEEYISNKIGEFDDVINTGNISIDAMLNYYKQRIRETLDVNMETELSIPSNLKIDTISMGIILGNALENALEACELLQSSKRFVRVKATVSKGRDLMLIISNPYLVDPVSDGEGNLITTKPAKDTNGLGIASANELLSKHSGYIHTEYENNIFKFMLICYNIL